MYIPMNIHKITQSVDFNWWLKLLHIQLAEPTNQNSKVPNLGKPTNTKAFYKTLGTSVINRPLSPPFNAKTDSNNLKISSLDI